jgi:hypothetical protein
LAFKTWQIFVFSLIPLALVFAGVIGGSFHGSDSNPEVFPTPPPAPSGPGPGGSGPGAPPAPAGSTVLQIVANTLMFDRRTLSAPPNRPVTVRMDNRDAGVIHNFAVYDSNRLTNKIFAGELHTGPGFFDYNFTSPAAGNYFFRCDVHPDTMTGTFTAR